ncbi:ABC transporter substrate-binding protein [Vibrio maerlii]|uniref:ABC transporter substrate-binding protein n=1 Tax=Vibrio maerlii TaxID=2231648 RepID=UPI000E3E7833|nr:ABC transporter substrate-binding protein [Vibrio maerlii]
MKKNKILLAMAALASAASVNAQADTIKWECDYSFNHKKAYCEYVQERFESETGHKLQFVELPPASDEKLGIYQQSFAAKSADVVDVFRIDTVWPGLFARHLLDLTPHFESRQGEFFKGAWDNNVVDGKLVALPSMLDAGLLYYRKDLLEKHNQTPPQSWQELKATAELIQAKEREDGQKDFWGFVFQGKAYEGLTCDALEWVNSYGGGSVVENDGTISINNPQAAEALDMAASMVGNISPKGVLGYMEEEARAVFQNGDALFMRNWPYAYVLGQGDQSPVKGKVGIMPLPSGTEGGSGAATLGGWQWTVNGYTKSPEAAVQLLDIITSPEAQKMQFKHGGDSPTLMSLYDDPEILEIAPHMSEYKDIFAAAVARPAAPTKRQYAKVSKAFYNASFDVLTGKSTGEEAVASLEKRLKRVKGKKWK